MASEEENDDNFQVLSLDVRRYHQKNSVPLLELVENTQTASSATIYIHCCLDVAAMT
ncbi:GD12241 [Drosophila simulans]|uniref:GD12241 n=1 Tax=Drosophila simulans TaxID=7240 RepID=B4QRC7_DROSI|nr:GD12241 [Drosophila simulans]